MNFLKKNAFTLLLTGFLLALLLLPDFRAFVVRQILMKPTLEKVENEVTLTDEEMQLPLKGVNVANANLSDFKNKVIFLNFWGSWCPPCRAEFPSIQKLYESQKTSTVFVLVAMQDQEEDVKKFLQQNHFSTPVYFAQGPLSEKLLPKSFPTTLIIGQDGRILQKEEAAKDWNAPEVHRFLNQIHKK